MEEAGQSEESSLLNSHRQRGSPVAAGRRDWSAVPALDSRGGPATVLPRWADAGFKLLPLGPFEPQGVAGFWALSSALAAFQEAPVQKCCYKCGFRFSSLELSHPNALPPTVWALAKKPTYLILRACVSPERIGMRPQIQSYP